MAHLTSRLLALEGMNSFLVLHLNRNSETEFWIALRQHVKRPGKAARLESDYVVFFEGFHAVIGDIIADLALYDGEEE